MAIGATIGAISAGVGSGLGNAAFEYTGSEITGAIAGILASKGTSESLNYLSDNYLEGAESGNSGSQYIPQIEPVFYRDRLSGEEIFLGYNSIETIKRRMLLQTHDPISMIEQGGDIAIHVALTLNVATLGAIATGNIPAAETFGVIAAGADLIAFSAYTISGNQGKAFFSLISVGIDVVPLAAVSLKPAYNPVAKRFIDATTRRFITNSLGRTKYAIYPASNLSYYGAALITPEFEKSILKHFNYYLNFAPKFRY
jgi:hypothetical protein